MPEVVKWYHHKYSCEKGGKTRQETHQGITWPEHLNVASCHRLIIKTFKFKMLVNLLPNNIMGRFFDVKFLWAPGACCIFFSNALTWRLRQVQVKVVDGWRWCLDDRWKIFRHANDCELKYLLHEWWTCLFLNDAYLTLVTKMLQYICLIQSLSHQYLPTSSHHLTITRPWGIVEEVLDFLGESSPTLATRREVDNVSRGQGIKVHVESCGEYVCRHYYVYNMYVYIYMYLDVCVFR